MASLTNPDGPETTSHRRTVDELPMLQSTSSDPVALCSIGPSANLTDAFEPTELRHRNTQSIAIRDLHPTQLTVGYREVAERRRRWCVGSTTVESAARSLIVPVVLGPCARSYILDRHHELCALAAEGIAEVQVAVVDDLRRFEWVGFWRTLDRRGWCRPRDADGQRQDYSYIPTTLDGLVDDPFRSLARALRRAGGYEKQETPFSDFLWADFLRGQVARTLINDDFEAALRAALAVARNGGPTPSPALRKATTDFHPKAPGLLARSCALGEFDAVRTDATRKDTSAEHTGTVT